MTEKTLKEKAANDSANYDIQTIESKKLFIVQEMCKFYQFVEQVEETLGIEEVKNL